MTPHTVRGEGRRTAGQAEHELGASSLHRLQDAAPGLKDRGPRQRNQDERLERHRLGRCEAPAFACPCTRGLTRPLRRQGKPSAARLPLLLLAVALSRPANVIIKVRCTVPLPGTSHSACAFRFVGVVACSLGVSGNWPAAPDSVSARATVTRRHCTHPFPRHAVFRH